MKLNKLNNDNDIEDIKENDKENEKENNETEEKEEGKSDEEGEEEEEDDANDVNDVNEANDVNNANEIYEKEEYNDYEDNNKNKMIGQSKKEKKVLKKSSNCKFFSIIIVVLFLFISIIFFSVLRRKKKNKIKEIKLSPEQMEKVKNELNNQYNNNGEINVIKFYEENILQKAYTPPNVGQLKNVYITVGFNESEIDTAIIHLASALYHSSHTTFLNIHMMDANTISYESILKLKNLIYRVNNNTEIIVHNAAEVLNSFKIREDSVCKFAKEYAKLYAFKLIKNVQKILMLDSDDIMIQKDFSQLFDLDMTDAYCRGVSELPGLRHQMEWIDQYLSDKSHYINGGVILINLELCQKEDFFNKARELNNNNFYVKTEEPVQDILNVLMKRKIEFFHPKFNKINFYEKPEDRSDEGKWYPWATETLKQSEKNIHIFTKEELLQADTDPVIIHYAWEKQLNKVVKKYEDDKEFYANITGLC